MVWIRLLWLAIEGDIPQDVITCQALVQTPFSLHFSQSSQHPQAWETIIPILQRLREGWELTHVPMTNFTLRLFKLSPSSQSVCLSPLSSLFCSFISGNPSRLAHVEKARWKRQQDCQSGGTSQNMYHPKRNQLHFQTLALPFSLGLLSDCASQKIYEKCSSFFSN